MSVSCLVPKEPILDQNRSKPYLNYPDEENAWQHYILIKFVCYSFDFWFFSFYFSYFFVIIFSLILLIKLFWFLFLIYSLIIIFFLSWNYLISFCFNHCFFSRTFSLSIGQNLFITQLDIAVDEISLALCRINFFCCITNFVKSFIRRSSTINFLFIVSFFIRLLRRLNVILFSRLTFSLSFNSLFISQLIDKSQWVDVFVQLQVGSYGCRTLFIETKFIIVFNISHYQKVISILFKVAFKHSG